MPPKKTESKKPTTGKNKSKSNDEITNQAPENKKRVASERKITSTTTTRKNKAQKSNDEIAEVPERKKKVALAKSSKKTKAEPVEAETQKTTKTKRKVAESNENGEPGPSTEKKTKTTRSKRTKNVMVEETQENEEAPSDIKKRSVKKGAVKKGDKKESGASEPKTVKNVTATSWENINFNCTSKSAKGKTSNFHITSWNVDGLRAWLKKGGLNILQNDQPNVFCIQETKCALDKLPEEIKTMEGYESFWCSSDKDGYAGVGVVTKAKPLNVIYGINSETHDSEGRCITVEFNDFYLVNVYVPNAGRKLVTLPKRLDWNQQFKEFVKNLDKQKPVIVCGDMNVAHKEIDLANPKTNTKNAGFTLEEREGMTDFLGDGYVDSFRQLYPDKEKAYTFWTYMSNARTKNVGWRLDYFLVSKRFMDNVCDNIIHSEVFGSDHCPLSLHINI